jgi:hypothetical protein
MVVEKPAARFPIMKITIAAVKVTFLPNISLNLP